MTRSMPIPPFCKTESHFIFQQKEQLAARNDDLHVRHQQLMEQLVECNEGQQESDKVASENAKKAEKAMAEVETLRAQFASKSRILEERTQECAELRATLQEMEEASLELTARVQQTEVFV